MKKRHLQKTTRATTVMASAGLVDEGSKLIVNVIAVCAFPKKGAICKIVNITLRIRLPMVYRGQALPPYALDTFADVRVHSRSVAVSKRRRSSSRDSDRRRIRVSTGVRSEDVRRARETPRRARRIPRRLRVRRDASKIFKTDDDAGRQFPSTFAEQRRGLVGLQLLELLRALREGVREGV